MNEQCHKEFYRGWIVETEQEETGHRGICYSPSRLCLNTHQTYSSELYAISVSKAMIDRHIACRQISIFLRDLYEAGNLEFEEWRSLCNSLAC